MVARVAAPSATRSLIFALVLVPILGIGLLLAPSPALGVEKGKWTGTHDWSGGTGKYAVHMALVPGDNNPYNSRIVWWRGETYGNWLGGEWGWRSGNESCTTFPTTSFDALPLGAPGVDIFCSGQAAMADGRLFLPGGTDPVTGIYGENKSKIYTRGSGTSAGTWSNPPEMVDWRWYPSATTMRDGRMLVTSGLRHPNHRVFGGKRDGSLPPDQSTVTPGDSLYRFAPVDPGAWDKTAVPLPDGANDRPTVREGHTFVDMSGAWGFGGDVLFGGQGATVKNNDSWLLNRNDNPTGDDYSYQWTKLNPQGTPPIARSNHASVLALDSMMVAFGGSDDAGPRNDVHRLSQQATGRQWFPITPAGSIDASWGHSAIYDTSSALINATWTALKRMIVFGGMTSGPSPTDLKVYELRLGPTQQSTATWSEMNQVDLGGPKPAPRHWASISLDPTLRTRIGQPSRQGHVAFLYGGALGDTAYSDTLWKLWIFQDGTVGWELLTVSLSPPGTGPRPGKRARHSSTFDINQVGGRLYIYGGENNSGTADRFVYIVDPWSGNPTWYQWRDLHSNLSGHTALLERNQTLSRTPEVFTPSGATGTWQALTTPLYWTHSYPLNFVVPRGPTSGITRIITVGQDPRTYWLDIPPSGQPSQGWQTQTTPVNLTTGFFAQTAVLYRPDSILVAGGKTGPGQVLGTTKRLATSSLGAGWLSSGSMQPRYFHNLVLLPDGKVLAVGGNGTTSQGNDSPVKRPQIWDPAGSNGQGAWTDTSDLVPQPTVRGYHSTAILLPDGRVLSAGGDFHNDKYLANIFCPPYLFKSDDSTLAPRPVIQEAPASLDWKKTFTICVADTTGITRVCLIRSGATTHAFDENQRYVPLSFVKAGSPARLFVTSPASADTAPPGYYLLFLTGSKEGSTAYPDEPSLAKWVRLGPSGRDTCDTTNPATITTLAPDVVTPTSVDLFWTATADDGSLAASGPAQEFDLRWKLTPIDNEGNWATAHSTSGEPIPGPNGTVHGATVGSLMCCTWHHFAIRSKDDNANPLSPIHNQVKVKTVCTGCSGLRTGPTEEVQAMRLASTPPTSVGGVPTPQVAGGPTSSGLIVETRGTSGGGWQLVARRVAEVSGDGTAAAGTILLQDRSAEGTWSTRRSLPPRDGAIGLCALREDGRAILFGDWSLDQLAPTLKGAASNVLLAAATHSRLGALDVAGVASGTGAELLDGDAIALSYEPNALAAEPTESWYVLVSRSSDASGLRGPVAAGPRVPVRFALLQNHPNPFGRSTSIRFELPARARVKLDVFDLLGRRVVRLSDREHPAGFHAIDWDRRDGDGNGVRSGVLVYRLEAVGPEGELLFEDQKKMVLLAD